jgi:hypothetical protein
MPVAASKPSLALRGRAKRASRAISASKLISARKAAVVYPVPTPGSLYDRARHLIGTISGPGDLSTNPRHMDGYGAFRRP